MQEARDEVFCHLVAKRAVARAALHLGIQAMTAESLDVLADVLLQYMQRIGKTAAHQVEASGRSSSHVNVLDAIRAVELNTTAAVQHIHLPGELVAEAPSVGTTSAAAGTDARHQLGWKGLAAFLFGPDWHKQSSTTAAGTPTVTGALKGKVGPSATATAVATELANPADGTETSGSAGWEAPYPEEVPAFPVASSRVANPHPLTSAAALESLHTSTIIVETQESTSETDNKNKDVDDKTAQDEEKALDVPDSVFTHAWGSYERVPEKEKPVETLPSLPDTTTTGKRKRDDEDGEPAAKKAKVSFAKTKEDKTALVETLDHHDPTSISHLLPPFYPPLPSTLDSHRRTITDAESTKPDEPAAESSEVSASDHRPVAHDTSSKSVRSALVQLGQQHYWGSGWDDDHEAALEVPAGGGTPGKVTPQIVPLGRASGSRVSRILEGSMDPGASM